MRLYLAGPISTGTQTFRTNSFREAVRLLVSYAYVNPVKPAVPAYGPGVRNVLGWALDSGAFTAYSKGTEIDHERYIKYAKGCGAEDVFGLDVIGDPDATAANLEKEWAAGLNSIPTIHYGQATAERVAWARSGPTGKIAIGGVARMSFAKRWNHTARVFQLAWPCKIHGLGITDPRIIASFPFDSVDSSSWQFAPLAFDMWSVYGGMALKTPARVEDVAFWSGGRNLWNEVATMLDLERRATAIWKPLFDRTEF